MSNYKLPNFYDDPKFNSLRQQMGASRIDHIVPAISRKPLELIELAKKLGTTGIEVKFEELETLDDSSFCYKGNRVIVYIPYISEFYAETRNQLPKYHLFNTCRTLIRMESEKRSARYTIYNGTDGRFPMKPNLGYVSRDSKIPTIYKKLDVCKNCLTIFNGQTKKQRKPRVEVNEFTLELFFSVFSRETNSDAPKSPKYASIDDMPADDYAENHADVRDDLMAERGTKCEECYREMAGDMKNLHMHHINGIKQDNVTSNLKLLCYDCHARQPHHSHMKRS